MEFFERVRPRLRDWSTFSLVKNTLQGLVEVVKEGGAAGSEAAAVMRGEAVGGYGGTVVAGRVALVLCPVVGGIVGGEALHQFVAVGFGEDGGGCYGSI